MPVTPVSSSTQLLNEKAAAAFLGCSYKTLQKWRSTRTPQLPFVKLGGLVRYRMLDLERFINESVVNGEAPKPKGRKRRGDRTNA